jgi:predicted transcriptional regulator
VSEIMSRDVVVVKADLGIDDFEEILINRKISGAPVVDDRGKPIGIVSKTDLLHRKGTPPFEGLKVKDIMMRTAYCLAENEPIARAAGLMAYEGVHRLPVVDSNGTVIGVTSPLDIMRWLARQYGYPIGNRP